MNYPKINKDVCLSIFIIGILGHYDNNEVIKEKDIQYIASTLKKKNFPIKNGTDKERILANPERTKQELKRTKKAKKKEQIEANYLKAIKSIIRKKRTWDIHAKISDNAWLNSKQQAKELPSSVSGLIYAILRKNESFIKWYSFNKKRMEQYMREDTAHNPTIFRSSLLVTKLINNLESEIELYNTDPKSYYKKYFNATTEEGEVI